MADSKFTWLILSFCLPFISSAQNSFTAEQVNLGANINSTAGEINPVISADGKTLYFVRDGHNQNKAGQDIWYSVEGSDGAWQPAKHPGPPLNQGVNSGVFNISTDGNQLMVRGAYVDGEFESSGISMVSRTEKGFWSDPEKIEIKNFTKYSDKGKYYGAFLCNSGKTILFYFTDDSNKGLADIYVSHLIYKENNSSSGSLKELGKKIKESLKNNTWTEPKKIGNLNTSEFDELAPFLAADGVTLYFSSNRAGSIGSNDIWKSTRLDDTWENWSTPKNLGAGINSTDWDCYYTIDAKGEQAYMVSWKNSLGAADIVKISLSETQKPKPVVLISGKVYNAITKETIGDATVEYEDLATGNNMGVAISNAQDGSYKIVLPYGTNYGFMGYADKYISISDNIDLSSVAGYLEISRDLYLAPLTVGSTIRLNNIFFDFGKANLRTESYPEIQRLAGYLVANEAMEIEISGHTDNIGSDEANLKLSEDRAKAVSNYLISLGIKSKRITSKGYGETKPLYSNDNETSKQLNRRVEFTILKN